MISILYVDDEPGLLELGQLFLEQTGEFRVDTVLSGQEALARIKKNQYDAVVSDYQMPEMDGISLLKKIRQSEGDLPFILFTGRGREEVVIEAVNNGVDFYLQKGGDPKAQFAELMHKVRQAVTRKQAEKELKESEKRLTDIIDFLPDATFAIDRAGQVIAWNRAIEDLTGIPAGDMLGKGDFEYAIPFYGHRRPILIDLIFEPEEKICAHYSGIRREKGTLIAETDLPRPRGMALTLMGKASPLYDRRGKVAGAIESIRDITARKQEEDELRAAYEAVRLTEEELRRQYENIARSEQVLKDSEEKYRTLVENSQDIIYIYRNDRLLVINRRGPEILGYSEEELRHMQIWDLLHPDDRHRVQDRGRARFDGEEVPSQYTARILTKSGRVIPMELAAMLITYQGEPAIMGIAHDVTEREELISAMARKTKTLTIINQLVQTADKNWEINPLLDQTLTSVREFLGFEAGGIYLIDEPMARGRIVCTQNLPEDFIRKIEDTDTEKNPFSSDFFQGEMVFSENFRPYCPEAAEKYGYRSVTGIPITAEQRLVGVLIAVSTRAVIFSAEDREVLLIIGRELGNAIMRMRAETALHESEEQYRTLIETTGTGFVIIDEQGRVADANQEYIRLTGHHSLAEIKDRRVTEWTAAWDYDRNEQAVRDCFRTGSLRNFDVDYVDGAGCVTPVEINATVVNKRGNAQIITLCRDISGRRKAEEKLRGSEASLASIIRAAPIGIGVVTDRIITRANDRLCEMTGYSRDELVGKNARILYLSDADYEYVGREKYRQIREKGTGSVETRWQRKDGAARDILLSSTPGDVTRPTTDVTFTALDITERMKAQSKLQEAYEKLSAREKELRGNYEAIASAEQEVRKTERQLREITSTIPGVVFQFLVAPDGVVTDVFLCERTMEFFYGTRAGTIERFGDGVHPEDRQAFLLSRDLAIRNGESWNFEGRFIRPSGEQVWFQVTATPVETDKGVIYSGIVLDITARKRTEETLRRTEALYGTLADEAQDLIYIIARDYTVTYVNRYAALILGRSKEDIIGKPCSVLFSGPAGERQHQSIERVFESGEPIRLESRILVASGESWQNIHLIPLRDPEGRVMAVLGISRDITGMKETEEALRRSETQYRSIVDNMEDMFYRTDAAGKLIMVSPAGARMAGYASPEEMMGIDIAREIYVDSEQRKKFLITLSKKGSVTGYPVMLKGKNGRQFHATASSHFYYDAQGRVAGVEGMIHDVTDLHQAEAALKEANRKLNLLNSITRHDVANQLTVLQGYSQLAMLKNTDPVISDFLEKIDAVASTVARQIEFSKAYQELGVSAPGWHLLDDILMKNRPKDILFSTTCSGIEVFADPMLEKVFANLFGNSIMHGEHVTQISVRCEPAGDNLMITVEDNGIGIPLNEKQNIFRKGYGKHTGFGLFLAREILAITGISIHETGRHGSGARFEILIPKNGFRQGSG